MNAATTFLGLARRPLTAADRELASVVVPRQEEPPRVALALLSVQELTQRSTLRCTAPDKDRLQATAPPHLPTDGGRRVLHQFVGAYMSLNGSLPTTFLRQRAQLLPAASLCSALALLAKDQAPKAQDYALLGPRGAWLMAFAKPAPFANDSLFRPDNLIPAFHTDKARFRKTHAALLSFALGAILPGLPENKTKHAWREQLSQVLALSPKVQNSLPELNILIQTGKLVAILDPGVLAKALYESTASFSAFDHYQLLKATRSAAFVKTQAKASEYIASLNFKKATESLGSEQLHEQLQKIALALYLLADSQGASRLLTHIRQSQDNLLLAHPALDILFATLNEEHYATQLDQWAEQLTSPWNNKQMLRWLDSGHWPYSQVMSAGLVEESLRVYGQTAIAKTHLHRLHPHTIETVHEIQHQRGVNAIAAQQLTRILMLQAQLDELFPIIT